VVKTKRLETGCWWLTPVILAIQEAEIGRILAQGQPGQVVCNTLSRKTLHKNRLVKWLRVKDLSSKPSTRKKKEEERRRRRRRRRKRRRKRKKKKKKKLMAERYLENPHIFRN
jgi:hypothetical protein